jgi:uncharacterized protein (DUF433 family)
MQKYWQYISINPEIRFGKPCIKGTRISVSDILSWLASGMTHQEILEDYPVLLQEHIYASLSFAAQREEYTKIISENYEIVT